MDESDEGARLMVFLSGLRAGQDVYSEFNDDADCDEIAQWFIDCAKDEGVSLGDLLITHLTDILITANHMNINLGHAYFEYCGRHMDDPHAEGDNNVH